MGCDTLVALAPATHDRITLFAKNSDRPPRECQRIVQLRARRPPSGSPVRCQYLEIPEVAETATILGSQPYWLWGLEHGVNEHRVAIGNEMVFAREPLGAAGLTGMDLVRLGLERARTAAEALAVMTDLLERYGQGGSGQAHVEWPYHNAFLIADPVAAWILETSGRHWAARRVAEVGNVSNGLAIGVDWDRGSNDLTDFAVAQGWWSSDAGPVDFTAAYADESRVPPNLAGARRRRGLGLSRQSLRRGVLAVLRRGDRAGAAGPRRRRGRPRESLVAHAGVADARRAGLRALGSPGARPLGRLRGGVGPRGHGRGGRGRDGPPQRAGVCGRGAAHRLHGAYGGHVPRRDGAACPGARGMS